MNGDNEKFGWGLMICGVCVIGWQVYDYLRHDFWTPVSVITALMWMKVEWSLNPTDWLGLYKVLSIIPLSLTLFGTGLIVMMT